MICLNMLLDWYSNVCLHLKCEKMSISEMIILYLKKKLFLLDSFNWLFQWTQRVFIIRPNNLFSNFFWSFDKMIFG